ncbi:helix-turn-helix domain-containing protein [Desertifilum sp. FACHB-1129]|uniref:helix-turn-helix domain-containing protein n=1 Tax=unclassified Desertifilum TaxID=2621682 RepID=UPI00168714B3|nr:MULTISPECIES: helix-turn-helix domain-containing protein [unclassified Desertifilum]MBD2311152.1 helix-turn-helix domain-containing protein [Desertifilum sp. FACHB-1129]MBD2324019.1 helix-turn-helix domain-containing protein [Desertifilum sp. FACHB-866]MBD2333954.1 helix-turn-helix domain-containing protein [Desertifilum sp. FACHB-868]MDA0211266.1 helix-turn-helix domain-containing protein [Cyanobacteria bacterium FC1]
MAGVVRIEIAESSQELLSYLKQADNQEVKERIQALYWLKTHQVETVGTIASLVGKHRTTVSRWLSAYRKGGIEQLLEKGKSTGRKSLVSQEVQAKLQQELEDPEGFTSYKEVQQWLKVIEEVELSYSGVHKLVRYRLKGKLKVPRPTHKKQEKGVVEEFKKN